MLKRSAYLCVLCISALVFAAPALAQVPTPGRGSSPDRPRTATRAPKFDFRSNFWVNLYHFLYHQARLRAAEKNPESGPATSLARGVTAVRLADLAPEEQSAWTEALDYFAANFITRDLLFNGDMVIIKNRLVEWNQLPDLSASGLRAEFIGAMHKAAPIYRARWWPEHERANRAWIASIEPRVAKMGEELGIRLATAYQSQWPANPIGVDVTYFANWAGAYTSDEPLHVTLSSSDPRNQGDTAFEILYHEASHGLTRHVRDAIARECRNRSKPIPRDLWHAVLFYTTGEIVKRTLEAQPEKREYMAYAYRHGLFTQAWPQFLPLLERHWQPYLDGRISFDSAIARIVNGL